MNRALVELAESRKFGLLLLAMVVVFSSLFVLETLGSDASRLEEITFLLAGLALAYGSLTHVLCHYGYVRRLKDARKEALLVDQGAEKPVRFGALIPSYREEPEYVYRAMLSVALQKGEYKWLRLLVDDPPNPQADDQARLLSEARALPDRVRDFLAPLEMIAIGAERRALRNRQQAPQSLERAHRELARHFNLVASHWPESCSEDRFFRSEVLTALAVRHAGEAETSAADPEVALAELAKLRSRFQCDVATFERKIYANLSHAANKAMNLNTGLDLIGKRVVSMAINGERHLFVNDAGEMLFPPTEFVITLDADSLLSPFYAETLLAIATSVDASKVAVVQTPYAAFPEPASALERIAGATTDVQRITHQGFHYFGAAFWVGANAVLRLQALQEIAIDDVERGYAIRKYIQDHTPIEDTESTIDLAMKGWRVYNHNAVLAWSATPSDFGSLVIQRQRWACGGLIVVPKAIRAAAVSEGTRWAIALQLLVRLHYLGSLMWVPVALLVLLIAPFDDSLAGIFLPMVAVPYFIAYSMDLVLSGRSARELPQIYCLNLLLIPVNLAGAFASLRQMVIGRKVPFVRTPKILNRTASPAVILVSVWGGAFFLLCSAGFDAWLGNQRHAVFAMANGMFLLFAGWHFIGLQATREDLVATLEARRRVARQSAHIDKGEDLVLAAHAANGDAGAKEAA